MDVRDERVARNEALFREVNERIKDVTATQSGPDEAEFLCECGDEHCLEPIELTLAEYTGIRRVPTRFAVARGHVIPEIERVVKQNGRFTVVEKTQPDAARIAVQEDPWS